MPIVLKSGNLNLLERSGPVQACNGIALPFLLQELRSVQFHYIFDMRKILQIKMARLDLGVCVCVCEVPRQ